MQQYIIAQDEMGPADDLDNGGVLRFALAVNAFMYITIFISQDVDVSQHVNLEVICNLNNAHIPHISQYVMKVYIDLLVNQYQVDNLVVNKLLRPISPDKQLIVDKAEEIL